MSDFQQYRRKQIAELRPWLVGDDMDLISVSVPDSEAGSPKPGDMIARNPKNHADQWLVAAQYFADNFEPLDPRLTAAPGGEAAAPEPPATSDAMRERIVAVLTPFARLAPLYFTDGDLRAARALLAELTATGGKTP